jgi:hypothetical protein
MLLFLCNAFNVINHSDCNHQLYNYFDNYIIKYRNIINYYVTWSITKYPSLYVNVQFSAGGSVRMSHPKYGFIDTIFKSKQPSY